MFAFETLQTCYSYWTKTITCHIEQYDDPRIVNLDFIISYPNDHCG